MPLAKLFYFIFFSAAVCLVPFLTLYYQGLGLSGREIGLLVGIVPLVNMLGSSAWSMLSDATGKHRLLFLTAIVGTWLSVLGIGRATSLIELIPLVVVYAFCGAPIIPLVDNSVIDWAHVAGGDYGRTRVWGAYGWALGGALMGVVIERSGMEWAFYGYLALMLLLLVVAVPLPMSVNISSEPFWGALGKLLRNRSWLYFIGGAFVVGMAVSIYLNYLFPYVESLGFSRSVMGFSLTAATLSEIPLFLGSKRLLARWGEPLLLATSLFFVTVRSFAYVGMSAPWQFLAISLLHGPTFTLMWVAGVSYADRVAPRGLGATSQGVFGGLVMGGGVAVGAFAGGIIYDSINPTAVFVFAGVAALLTLLVFVALNWGAFAAQLRPAREAGI